MSVRTFRFGVSAASAPSRAEWQALARRVEAAGFATLVLQDHLVEGTFTTMAPIVSAADCTERLRFGTLVLNNDFRDPVLVSREAAAIDMLTDGRLELGLGAGHMAFEYEQIGRAFDDAKTRIERLRESVTIVRGLLDGEEVMFEGQHYRVNGQRVWPLPTQHHVPLLLGGNGDRMLTLAAECADIVGFTGLVLADGGQRPVLSHFTLPRIAERIEFVRTIAGDRFDDLELQALIQLVVATDDRHAAAESLASQYGVTVDDLLESPFVLLGTPKQMAKQLRERRDALGISYWVVFAHALDAMEPVLEELL